MNAKWESFVSLQDFWISIRAGSGFLTPHVTADSPLVDTDRVARNLQAAVIWLTPRCVDGFDENDFGFLPEAERRDLSQAVERFREIASRVNPKGRATTQQIQDALPPFLQILKILGIPNNKYADAEALIDGKRIEQYLSGHLPSSVVELRFETGDDSSGGPGLWVWVVFKDDVAADDAVLFLATEEVRNLVVEAVRRLGIERWPYVRFRTESDLKLVKSEG